MTQSSTGVLEAPRQRMRPSSPPSPPKRPPMTTGKVVATPRFDRATLAYVLIGLGCAALLFSIRLLFTESSVPERQLLASLGVILLALGMRRPS